MRIKKLILSLVLGLSIASNAFALPRAAQIGTDSSGWDGSGNLDSGDTTVQAVAQKVNDLDVSSIPGGALTSIQYNNGGALGGFGTWNGSILDLSGYSITAATFTGNLIGNVTGNLTGTASLATIAHTASLASTGDSASAFFLAGEIEHARGGLAADVSAYEGLIRITAGVTSNITNLAEFNTAIGASIVDGPHVIISDVAYDATSWNDNTDAATKNALRDKFESLVTVELNNLETVATDIALNEIPIGTSADTATYKLLPDCNVAGSALAYDNSTQTVSCRSGFGVAGSVAFDTITGGTNNILMQVDS